jgi:hypothetical protein
MGGSFVCTSLFGAMITFRSQVVNPAALRSPSEKMGSDCDEDADEKAEEVSQHRLQPSDRQMCKLKLRVIAVLLAVLCVVSAEVEWRFPTHKRAKRESPKPDRHCTKGNPCEYRSEHERERGILARAQMPHQHAVMTGDAVLVNGCQVRADLKVVRLYTNTGKRGGETLAWLSGEQPQSRRSLRRDAGSERRR